MIRFVAIIQGVFVGVAVYYALMSSPDGASGWWQVAIAIVGLPILLYELYEILKALRKKPKLDIGLATVKDLPTSKIRQKEFLPAIVEVSDGYPHFYLVIRNQEKIGTRYVKIHLEHKSSEIQSTPSIKRPPPLLRVDEFSIEKPQFHQENNVECVFIGGSEWIIHPKDTEVFGFYMTTSVVKKIIEQEHGEPIKIREFPAPGDCIFNCTLWAEGLDKPINKQLIVRIIDREIFDDTKNNQT